MNDLNQFLEKLREKCYDNCVHMTIWIDGYDTHVRLERFGLNGETCSRDIRLHNQIIKDAEFEWFDEFIKKANDCIKDGDKIDQLKKLRGSKDDWKCIMSREELQELVRDSEERHTAKFETDGFGNVWCGNCFNRADKHNNYCPNCGFRMVEPQESEEEE